MPKLVVGPIPGGLSTSVLPFNVDNGSFPVLINAYQWRLRVKRKRGTSPLTRFVRYFDSSNASYGSIPTITLDGTGTGNLLTGFGLQTNGSIVPGTVELDSGNYTDPAMDGTLSPSGTINYATGQVVIAALANTAIDAVFRYYPQLPVLGLEDLVLDTTDIPGCLGFDTTYSYNILTVFPYSSYNVSYYKNPPLSASLPGYVSKTTVTPTSWNSQTYQQIWSTNYQNALWATNGITAPFTTTNIGMQFKLITGVFIITAGNGTTIPAVADLTIVAHGLVRGDFIFINEVEGVTGINFQTGYVTSADPQAINTVTATFPFAILGGAYTRNGIAQYLTNRSDTTKDCLRWYDGDPTNGSVTSPTFVNGSGWVNFCPPLSRLNFSITDLPPRQYYLVGAKMILEYKDCLHFFGVVVQASTGNPIYLPDTVCFSQNGTPYYTASFTGDPSLATTQFNPILLPVNQTSSAAAFWEDQTGFGGFITAGLQQELNTIDKNEDVLIAGFSRTQARIVATGNGIDPFRFYLIDSELSSTSTFSVITMGNSTISRGNRGFINTTQRESNRFDEDILDDTLQIGNTQNGTERFTAIRDFDSEWIYFTYRDNQSRYTYPTETLFYNYRDKSWGKFKETYTHYGRFSKRTGFTWATVGLIYPTWSSWNSPWNSSQSTLENQQVIAGNQQGFVVVRDSGTTNEADSLTIQSINGAANIITCIDHCLNTGDYIVISGCLGTIGTQVNGKIFSIRSLTNDTFSINPSVISGTYFGGGLIKRMYVPFIQTKQFPSFWDIGRKTRLGVQQYLLTTTDNAQITLLIYLSQNAEYPYNQGNIVPFGVPDNNGLIYSTVLYTCIESTNLGLTPANINLQMIGNNSGSTQQAQIWHRINTSLIGDSVQLGFTMSDTQMRDTSFANQFSEIELHGFNMDLSPSQVLS